MSLMTTQDEFNEFVRRTEARFVTIELALTALNTKVDALTTRVDAISKQIDDLPGQVAAAVIRILDDRK